MHLSFLPEDEIFTAFRQLRAKCVGRSFSHKVSQLLIQLFDYFYFTWIKGDLFEISDWCMFRERHRTNNICEGYHSHLVRVQFKAKMNVYALIYRLFQESTDLPAQLESFKYETNNNENSIARQKDIHLCKMWTKLELGLVTTSHFLDRMNYKPKVKPNTKFADKHSRSHLQ